MRPISEVHNEDCMIGMSRYPDKFFDLAIVDPPYGIDVARMAYTQADNREAPQKNGSKLRVKKLMYKHGDWDKASPSQDYFNDLKRVSKNQIIWGWNYYGLNWGSGRIKWNKLQPEGVTFGSFEYAYCSMIDDEIEFKFLWAGMLQAKSLAEPTVQQGNKSLNERRIHPTQKPVALYKWLLNKFGNDCEKILDTHMGSQSSRIASYLMGFDYWGWEIDKEYFDKGNQRFKEQTAQIQLF
jgi:site-specific DNA-methyltransferase (adenine-specific)